jgi:hypothetical protein
MEQSGSERQIAKSGEPIDITVIGARAEHGRKALMQTTRSNAMIVPHGQQSQQARRKGAMHRQMGTYNAVPVLHDTTGSYRLIPCRKELMSDGVQSRGKSFRQGFQIRSQDASARP